MQKNLRGRANALLSAMLFIRGYDRVSGSRTRDSCGSNRQSENGNQAEGNLRAAYKHFEKIEKYRQWTRQSNT